MCVCVCVNVSLPTIGFFCTSAEIYEHSFFFPTTDSASSFEIPVGQQIGDQREKQVLQPETADSDSGLNRLKTG